MPPGGTVIYNNLLSSNDGNNWLDQLYNNKNCFWLFLYVSYLSSTYLDNAFLSDKVVSDPWIVGHVEVQSGGDIFQGQKSHSIGIVRFDDVDEDVTGLELRTLVLFGGGRRSGNVETGGIGAMTGRDLLGLSVELSDEFWKIDKGIAIALPVLTGGLISGKFLVADGILGVPFQELTEDAHFPVKGRTIREGEVEAGIVSHFHVHEGSSDISSYLFGRHPYFSILRGVGGSSSKGGFLADIGVFHRSAFAKHHVAFDHGDSCSFGPRVVNVGKGGSPHGSSTVGPQVFSRPPVGFVEVVGIGGKGLVGIEEVDSPAAVLRGIELQ